MTSLNSAPSARTWPQTSGEPTETPSVILSVKVGADVSLGALSAIRESVRILSAFAWGKESRLSQKKSAQLCDLMNA